MNTYELLIVNYIFFQHSISYTCNIYIILLYLGKTKSRLKVLLKAFRAA